MTSKPLLIRLSASALSVCVPTRLIFVALRILAVLLGLAIRFSKSDLRCDSFAAVLLAAEAFYMFLSPLCNFFVKWIAHFF